MASGNNLDALFADAGLPEDPKGRVIRGSSRNIARRFPLILGFLGSPITGFSAPLPGQQCKEFRARSSGGSHSSVPVSDVPTRLGIPARLFHASLRVGHQAGKPAPGQSPPRFAPRTIYGNMLHLSDWHRKVRPQSSWWPSAGRTTRKTFSRDWKKSIEEISPREWEKFQERHPETISIGKRERGAEPG